MEFHEFANVFPLMPESELQLLADDIRDRGLNDTIKTFEGKILDGRNRQTACTLAGVQPRYEEFTGSRVDALRYVWSENYHRRHLTSSQGAGCTDDYETQLAGVLKAEAKERQKKGGSKGGKASGRQRRGEMKAGQRIDQPSRDNSQRTDAKIAKSAGTNRQYVADVRKIKQVKPELVEEIKAGKKTVPQAKRELAREQKLRELEDVTVKEAKAIDGVYDVIVIDPPWPIKKIERDCRPNQVELDYPTMGLGELCDLDIPCATDCHVWLWTTHRFLPDAFELLNDWGLKYVCTFTWHKPGGFQPVGLPQFNCEFALYARMGSPSFIDTKALSVCFSAGRGKHSEKPSEFYDLVRRVTAGRRLDMFNRRQIAGFHAWGKEAVS